MVMGSQRLSGEEGWCGQWLSRLAITLSGLFWGEMKYKAGRIGCGQRSGCQTKTMGVYFGDCV